MKYLVTGVAGFIGSHLVERLLLQGHRVIGVDNFDQYYDRAIKEQNLDLCRSCHAAAQNFSFLEADICEPETFENIDHDLSRPIDAIIHLAGKTGGCESIHTPSDFIRHNLIGTQQVLDYARRRGVEQFVFSSNASIYGDQYPNPVRVEEDPTFRPKHPYAATKHSAEMLGRIYSDLHGIRFVSLRFGTVYGPRQRPDMAIAKFLHAAAHGQPLPLRGRVIQLRDYLYIGDALDAIERALHYKESEFEVFNIGSGQSTRLSELVRQLEKVLHIECKTQRRAAREGEIDQIRIACDKATERLGFTAYTTLADGLHKQAQWYNKINHIPLPANESPC